MGIYGGKYILEQFKITNQQSMSATKTTATINGINVSVVDSDAESDDKTKDKLMKDLSVDIKVVKTKYKNIQNGDKFKNWLKISDEEFKTLELYEIIYSNTGVHEFEFRYEYKDDKGNTFPIAMVIPIDKNKILYDKIHFYDI
jgi:hypothetical protein